MPISLIANRAATVSRQSLESATNEVKRAISKISSGNRVFEAQEDAASLAIGTGLRLDSAVLKSASINAQTGISLMQVADGAVGEIQNILDRMEGLVTQAMSGQLGAEERQFIDVEYQNMTSEIDRIVNTTEFNGVHVLGGTNEVLLNTVGTNVDSDNGFVGYSFDSAVDPTTSFRLSYVASTKTLTMIDLNTTEAQTIAVDQPDPGFLTEYTFAKLGVTVTLNDQFDVATDMPYTGATEEISVIAGATPTSSSYEFQLGTGTDTYDRITVNIDLVNTLELGLAGTNTLTVADATTAKTAIHSAVDKLSGVRAQLGANINRMQVAANNIAVSLENNELARSALLDTDVATEITNLTTQQMIVEASTSMLAQANAQPQSLLKLLQG